MTVPPAQSDSRQRLLLVTGLAGAGKSTVLAVLEDLGWETIDNFPIRMLERLVGEPGNSASNDDAVSRAPLAIGFDSRTRGFVPGEIISLVMRMEKRSDLALSFIFLDCKSTELERRFNETRRRHPMAQENTVHDGIAAERELLEPLRRWAEVVIDTSELSSNDLQTQVRTLFDKELQAEPRLTVSSFGFARGMPPLADLVFDMRFLDNPHWVEALRERTGQDREVGEHIKKDPAFAQAFKQIHALLLTVLPRYHAQGKAYVHVAFGCTGGRHRSVFTAEGMAQALREAGFSPTVRHRNLKSRVTDTIEGGKEGPSEG
ncbi:RNase adapter RapZ [uncultured Erythrobacter sp.]|uniref:RNase adapter RapZ n=1 Tax=uncultured Erythrobacter sp. TaxID=263913 RepID=UPI00262CD445|nr:RNase adapter RapZ [uncultured Erythrobacter sp.]